MPTMQDLAATSNPQAELQAYKAQRMKGVWFRLILSAVLLVIFGLSLTQRLEQAQRNDTTTTFLVVTAIVLARFGYYLWRVITAHRDVEAKKRSLGL